MKNIDLTTALTVVSQFTSTDSTLPLLGSVKLEVIGNELQLLATDRYTLAKAVVKDYDSLNGSGEWQAVLSRAQVSQVLSLLKTSKTKVLKEKPVFINFTESANDTVGGEIEVMLHSGESIRFHTELERAYPPVRRLIPAREDIKETGPVAVNPKYLARLTKLPTGGEPLVTIGDTKRNFLIARQGDWFESIIVGMRYRN